LFSQEGIHHLIKLLQGCIPNQYKQQDKPSELDDLVNDISDEKSSLVTRSINMSMEVFNIL
jgi:hypothetical protein